VVWGTNKSLFGQRTKRTPQVLPERHHANEGRIKVLDGPGLCSFICGAKLFYRLCSIPFIFRCNIIFSLWGTFFHIFNLCRSQALCLVCLMVYQALMPTLALLLSWSALASLSFANWSRLRGIIISLPQEKLFKLRNGKLAIVRNWDPLLLISNIRPLVNICWIYIYKLLLNIWLNPVSNLKP